jgi:hypothetical protein
MITVIICAMMLIGRRFGLQLSRPARTANL